MSWSQLAFRIVAGLIALFILAGLAATFTPIRIHRGPSVETWASKLRKDLPLGSSYESVTAYLTDAGIEHSTLVEKNRKVYAIIRDTCWAALLQCSIDMEFSFDDHNHLSDISVKEGLTGL